LQSIRACQYWTAAAIGQDSRFAIGAAQPYNQRLRRVHGADRISDSCLHTITSLNAKENSMSAPSRRPEIRRRRTRAEKVAKLRKRLAAASASTDKDRLAAKLHRVGLVSPGNPLIKSA